MIACPQQQNLKLICPATVSNLEQNQNSVQLTLVDGRTITSKLVIAADGSQSTIRQLLSIDALEHNYQQTAVTANVTPEQPHQHCAYERFTDTGPIALLPMTDNRCSLIWTVKSGDEKALLNCSEHEFLTQLQDRFGYRLGTFNKVGKRQYYPLKLMQAEQPVQHRVVLIGNAAHRLHPIAGQGFNLGLRDVAVLANVMTESDDCGDARLLHDYQQWRQHDQDNTIQATETLVNLFSNNNSILGHLRAGSLSVIDTFPAIKHWLAQKSMGLDGKQPRLSRGIPL